ncbi:MAG: NHL repeat-containing protein [Acidobacteria bacterium]|nr:NHL repeat-containing protein [Acidobacteriota bacterium]
MTSRTCADPRGRPHRLPVGGVGVALLFAAAGLLGVSCGRKETAGAPGTGGGAPAPAAKPTETLPVAAGPSIQAAAAGNQTPWAGLKSPSDASLDEKGRLWVVDQGGSALRIFDGNGGSLGGWGGRGTGEYAMKDPSGIAIHGDNVYVADTYNTGVEVFSQAGQWKGKSSAGLYNPHDVAVGADGQVWITDTGNGRIVVCGADLGSPRSVGKQGAGPEEFSAPIGIAIGPSGDVYVADAGNGRVQVLNPNGDFKGRWKFNGWGQNAEPYIDVDRDETLFVSDSVANVVVHLDRGGRELHRWEAGGDGKKLLRPRGVTVDRKNRVLYVVNTDANALSRIRLEK